MKYRHIDPSIRRSESVSKLDFRQRDLWYGLILTVDDQGRCPSNPALIRSDVWPLDDISLQEVADDLEALEILGFIQLYQDNGKQYLQLLNWHKYQSSSEWLGMSDYPPPPGWQDRYRFHGKNRQIIQSDNWMQPSPLPNELKPERSPLPFNDVKEEEKVNDKKEESKSTAPAPQFFNTGWHDQVFIQTTGISGIPRGDAPKVYEALDALRSKFTTEVDMVAYLKPYFEAWTKKKTKDGRYFSKSNCAWLYDWALAGDAITVPAPNRVYEVIHAPEHDPDCPLCHGKGKYMSEKSGRMVACDCVRVYEVVE